MERLIFHIDVSSAFLSWEAARRVQNGEDDLRLISSCIGGRPESRRGVVLAKSIPAKQYKIKTGEPIALALRKCPSLVIAPPDFKLYSACSKAFKDICRGYAPVVEEFSIDECFCDFTGTRLTYPDPIALAYEMRYANVPVRRGGSSEPGTRSEAGQSRGRSAQQVRLRHHPTRHGRGAGH